jgi:hypothetical protein
LPALPVAVSSLWHCPSARADWPLTSTLPCGARTFLPPPRPAATGVHPNHSGRGVLTACPSTALLDGQLRSAGSRTPPQTDLHATRRRDEGEDEQRPQHMPGGNQPGECAQFLLHGEVSLVKDDTNQAHKHPLCKRLYGGLGVWLLWKAVVRSAPSLPHVDAGARLTRPGRPIRSSAGSHIRSSMARLLISSASAFFARGTWSSFTRRKPLSRAMASACSRRRTGLRTW